MIRQSASHPRLRKPSVWSEVARRAALALPGVEERTSADGPVFTVGRKILARLGEDGASLVVYIDADEREMLMAAEPRTFSVAKGQGGHAMMRIHLAYVHEGSLRRILEQSWRERAPKRLQRPS
ncbi:MmcQ/YjbR family DNA-binding protein [Methylorubrum extorquens]